MRLKFWEKVTYHNSDDRIAIMKLYNLLCDEFPKTAGDMPYLVTRSKYHEAMKLFNRYKENQNG